MAGNLKIGFILDTSLDPEDGVQQYVITLGEWMRSLGHDVHYLVGETKKRQLKNVHSLARNFTVTFNGNKTTIPLPANRKKLQAFIRKENFDVLHVQTPHHPFMAQYLINACGEQTAVIATFHILPYNWLSRVGTRLLSLFLLTSINRIDRFLAVSKSAADFASKCYGHEFTVLPNVIDYPRFHEANGFERYGGDLKNVLFLGRLVPRKGCMILLEAIKLLQEDDKVPSFRTILCGKGALLKDIKGFINSNNLKNIEMTGFVSDEQKPRYYASSDISVFPSTAGESFGIVLLEAMASGNAVVIAGNNPGYASVLSSQPSLVLDQNEPYHLADKIKHYLMRDADRKQMAAWGAEYTKEYDVPVVGKQLLQIYRSSLRKRQQL